MNDPGRKPGDATGSALEATIAASYERVSTRIQGQYGFSLGIQHQTLEDFARVQGWILPEHLRFRDGEEENASGADWDLPDLTRMLEAARRHEFSVLAVPDFDRFARSLVKGLILEEQLKKYGVRVVYQRVPVEDTPEGHLLKTQLYAFAEYDRQKIALRLMLGRRGKAQTGRVVGIGPAPYGYRFTYETLANDKRRICGLEVDPITGPIARDILLNLRTCSTLDVMHDLNRRGIPSPSGKLWNATTLHRMGLNPVYMGLWVYGKHGRRATPEQPVGIPVPVPALIARDEWEEIGRAFAHRTFAKRSRGPIENDPWLLRGRLTCGHCHGAMQSVTNSGVRYYRCARHMPAIARHAHKPVCTMRDILASSLEAELQRILTEHLLDEENLARGLKAAREQHGRADAVRSDRLAALNTEIGRHRRRLEAMVDELIDAGPAAKDAIRRRINESEALIARLDRERVGLTTVRTDGLSGEEADEIQTFAAQVREGLADFTPADWRQLYDTLRIRGAAYLDPEGVQLGRYHAFRIEWDGALQLLYSLNRNLYRVNRSAE